MVKYINGDLIKLALHGNFDVICHGVNCFCNMGAGIAVKMAKEFECDKFPLEGPHHKGNINKLGQIDYMALTIAIGKDEFSVEDFDLTVVNCYTQYKYGINHNDGIKTPIDYDALTLCMRKLKRIFKGKRFGFPKIGAGLAGGDWDVISKIIETELDGEDVTVVIFTE